MSLLTMNTNATRYELMCLHNEYLTELTIIKYNVIKRFVHIRLTEKFHQYTPLPSAEKRF